MRWTDGRTDGRRNGWASRRLSRRSALGGETPRRARSAVRYFVRAQISSGGKQDTEPSARRLSFGLVNCLSVCLSVESFKSMTIMHHLKRKQNTVCRQQH